MDGLFYQSVRVHGDEGRVRAAAIVYWSYIALCENLALKRKLFTETTIGWNLRHNVKSSDTVGILLALAGSAVGPWITMRIGYPPPRWASQSTARVVVGPRIGGLLPLALFSSGRGGGVCQHQVVPPPWTRPSLVVYFSRLRQRAVLVAVGTGEPPWIPQWPLRARSCQRRFAPCVLRAQYCSTLTSPACAKLSPSRTVDLAAISKKNVQLAGYFLDEQRI